MKKQFNITIETEEEDFCFSDLKKSLFEGIDNIGNFKCVTIEETKK